MPRSPFRSSAGSSRVRWSTPSRVIVLGTLAVILSGTILLTLPVSRQGGEPPPLVDALFTAASALSVTGLTSLDTEYFWSPVGQLVILALIQIGGMGVMTLSTLLGILTARRMGLKARAAVASTGSGTLSDAPQIIRRIVATSFVIEAATALALFLRYLAIGELSAVDAFRFGVFHAVSAFNNAGFALRSDNMMSASSDPFLLVPLMVAVVLGGLGFPVIVELVRRYRLPRRWSMTAKLTLTGTAALLAVGTVMTLALESSNPGTLGPMTWPDRVMNALFHAVASRTAGFNAVDIGAMHPETWLGTDILMLIGGGPAGTAGGMKITTVLVLLLIIRSELRGDPYVRVFGRRLSRAVHREVITVVGLMMMCVVAVTFVLLIIEGRSLDEVLFEVTSAISTTGLSTGITADLHPVSKLLLVVLMVIGRVGPITLGTALALRHRPLLYETPKERPIIG